jgi:hypothetical protein
MGSYPGYFALNYVLELLMARLCLPSCGFRRLATVVLILNLVTHPILWLVLSQAFDDYWLKLLVGEVLVFTVEIILGLFLLRRHVASKARIAWTVFACNLFSFSFTFIV